MPTLCTLETVKHYAGISSVDTTQDGLLVGLLEAVERRFLTECSWDIVAATRTEYFCGSGKIERTFNVRPVTAVASLATQLSFESDTWDTVETTDYRLRESGGRYYLYYPSGFAEGLEYRVIYTAGYADTAIPADIQDLIATWTVIEYSQLTPSGEGLLPHQVSKSKGDKGISVSESFVKPRDAWDRVVSRYRRVPL